MYTPLVAHMAALEHSDRQRVAAKAARQARLARAARLTAATPPSVRRGSRRNPAD